MCMTKTNDEKLRDKKTDSECLVPIRYYSLENTSKFCAEGSVKNLLYMLRLSEYDVTVFWDLATTPLHSISERLRDVVPNLSVTTSAKLIRYRSVCGYFGNSLNSRQPKK